MYEYNTLVQSMEIILLGSFVLNFAIARIMDLIGLGRSRLLSPVLGTAVSWLIIWITVKTTQSLPQPVLWTAIILGGICTVFLCLFIPELSFGSDRISLLLSKAFPKNKEKEEELRKQKKIIDRSLTFYKESEAIYAKGASWNRVVDTLSETDLTDARVFYWKTYNEVYHIIFNSKGGKEGEWMLALEYHGVDSKNDVYGWEVTFPQYDTINGEIPSLETMNIMLTILEKMFLKIDPEALYDIEKPLAEGIADVIKAKLTGSKPSIYQRPLKERYQEKENKPKKNESQKQVDLKEKKHVSPKTTLGNHQQSGEKHQQYGGEQRYCSNCGHRLESDAQYCGHCGCMLERTQNNIAKRQGATSLKPEKKRTGLLVGLVSGSVILTLVLLVALWKFTSHYMAPLQGEIQYQESGHKKKAAFEENDEKTENDYLEQIESNPTMADSYEKLAKIYMYQHDHSKAEDILKKGKEAGCEKELEDTVAYIKIWEQYENYIALGQDQESRIKTGEKTSSCTGLLSAFVEDVDGDGLPELVTLSCSFDYDYSETDSQTIENIWSCRGLVLTIRLFGYDKDVVTLVDEHSFPCGGYPEHYRYDLFLHKIQDQYGFVLTLNGSTGDTLESTIRLFTFDHKKIKQESSSDLRESESEFINFWIDDKNKAHYGWYDDELEDVYDSEEEEKAAYEKSQALMKKHKREALEKVITEYNRAFSPYCLEDKLDFSRADINTAIKDGSKMPSFLEYDKNDPMEKHIACIEVGRRGDKDNWVQPLEDEEADADASIQKMYYFEDYSGRDQMKRLADQTKEKENEKIEGKPDEEALKEFLKRFIFFSAAVNKDEDFDVQNTDALKMMQSIMWNISCVEYDRYPGQKEPDELSEMGRNDPRGFMVDEEGNNVMMCYAYDADKVNWIMTKIFNYSRNAVDEAVARSEADLAEADMNDRASLFYLEDGTYYYLTGGIGWETQYDVSSLRLEYDNGVYNVEYKITESLMPGTEYEETKTYINKAKMKYQKIEGKYYWSMLENKSAEEAD